MVLPLAESPLGFPHCVKKGQPFSGTPAHPWAVTRANSNKSIRITWVCRGYSVADVQGNDGDGNEGNEHEKSNQGRGPYVANESQWVTKHAWQGRSGLGCRAGGKLLESLYRFPLRPSSRFNSLWHPCLGAEIVKTGDIGVFAMGGSGSQGRTHSSLDGRRELRLTSKCKTWDNILTSRRWLTQCQKNVKPIHNNSSCSEDVT